MKKLKRTIPLLAVVMLLTQAVKAQYPGAYPADISHHYYDSSTVFAAYPSYEPLVPLGAQINGSLGTNSFTASFANPNNLGNGGSNGSIGAGVQLAPHNWGPYIWKATSNGSTTPQAQYIDLSWRGSANGSANNAIPAGSTGTVTFSRNLDVQDQFIISDLGDGDEAVFFEFLNDQGNPVDLTAAAKNIRVVHLTADNAGNSAPLTYPSATRIAINASNQVTNVVNEGWAFVILNTGIRSVRFTQTGNLDPNAGNSWAFTFAKGRNDYGDAPETYGSAGSFSLGGLLRMGVRGGDTEVGPLYDAHANGDNNNNTNDEDGAFTRPHIPNNGSSGQTISSYSVTVSVTNRSGVPAHLMGWLDWNGNGLFDADEAATTDPIPTGTDSADLTLTWTNAILTGANGAGGTFLRLRISTAALNAATSATGVIAPADGMGEVEDYSIPFNTPLPVSFGAVSATIKNGQLFVNWVSETETNNDRFIIEVSNNGKNWKELATVRSKAADGNSSQKIDYSYSIPFGTVAGMFAIPALFAIGLASFGRRRKILLSLAIVALMAVGYSCHKNDASPAENAQKVWVRIAQADKDGTRRYSNVVRAIWE